MPKTSIACSASADGTGSIISFGSTLFTPLAGAPDTESSEPGVQTTTPSSLTVKNLFVRVLTNTINGATTVRTRKNGANGALSVSIPATITGFFEDTVNSDSLVAGDTSNYQTVTGGTSGSMTLSIFSSTLDQATTETSFNGVSLLNTVGAGLTRYFSHNSVSTTLTTESDGQYTIRFSATWRRLSIAVSSNSLGTASTLTSRKNGVNGAQSISIPAAVTGTFTDTVNSDSLVSGDVIDAQLVTGGMGTQTVGFVTIQYLMETSVTDSFVMFTDSNETVGFGITRYSVPKGATFVSATESDAQLKIRGATFTGQNLFVRVTANTLNGASTFRTRKNGANGALSVSVAAGVTGVFEDTVNTDSFAPGDFMNYQKVMGGTSGSITWSVGAVQMQIPPPPAAVIAFRHLISLMKVG